MGEFPSGFVVNAVDSNFCTLLSAQTAAEQLGWCFLGVQLLGGWRCVLLIEAAPLSGLSEPGSAAAKLCRAVLCRLAAWAWNAALNEMQWMLERLRGQAAQCGHKLRAPLLPLLRTGLLHICRILRSATCSTLLVDPPRMLLSQVTALVRLAGHHRRR